MQQATECDSHRATSFFVVVVVLGSFVIVSIRLKSFGCLCSPAPTPTQSRPFINIILCIISSMFCVESNSFSSHSQCMIHIRYHYHTVSHRQQQGSVSLPIAAQTLHPFHSARCRDNRAIVDSHIGLMLHSRLHRRDLLCVWFFATFLRFARNRQRLQRFLHSAFTG